MPALYLDINYKTSKKEHMTKQATSSWTDK